MSIVALGAVAIVVVSGCGGGGSSPGGADIGRQLGFPLPVVLPSWTVHEYRGDGHNGTKPMPFFVRAGEVSTQVQPPKLRFKAPARTGVVDRANIDWYYLQPLSPASIELIIMIQPTANEDADLYVLEGIVSDYDDGAACLGYSTRFPSDPGGPTPMGGYAPDWTAIDFSNTGGYPAAQVAVYGYEGATGGAQDHYRIEVDKPRYPTVNGAWLHDQVAYRQSDWFAFQATAGNQYTVRTLSPDNPSHYVYELDSGGFVGAEETAGGGIVQYTATETGTHYVRVFGASPGPNRYDIKVTSP